jgi:hypothetical protein
MLPDEIVYLRPAFTATRSALASVTYEIANCESVQACTTHRHMKVKQYLAFNRLK